VLAIVVGVSLLQAYRHKDALDSAYTKGAEQQLATSQSLKTEVDSLQQALLSERSAVNDSFTKTDAIYQAKVDSLENEVTSRDSIIAFQNTKAKKQATQTHAAAPVKKVDDKHQQILSYYRKRCESLPKDLSEYERKVAYAEIRTETAQKFEISITELNRLRTENKLTY
jgi:hypothetical protein